METKECPTPRVKCVNCQGYVKDGMYCRWGYKRTYEKPVKREGKDREWSYVKW